RDAVRERRDPRCHLCGNFLSFRAHGPPHGPEGAGDLESRDSQVPIHDRIMLKSGNKRMIAAIGGIAGGLLAFAVDAGGQTIRFSPGEDAPIALSSATHVY